MNHIWPWMLAINNIRSINIINHTITTTPMGGSMWKAMKLYCWWCCLRFCCCLACLRSIFPLRMACWKTRMPPNCKRQSEWASWARRSLIGSSNMKFHEKRFNVNVSENGTYLQFKSRQWWRTHTHVLYASSYLGFPQSFKQTHRLLTIYSQHIFCFTLNVRVPNQALRQQSRAKAVLRILMNADQGVPGKQLHHPEIPGERIRMGYSMIF